jgi:hypothetical protein
MDYDSASQEARHEAMFIPGSHEPKGTEGANLFRGSHDA